MSLVQHIEANAAGRDFVVGDLHGCRSQLQRSLDAVEFNPKVDRLFSAGDLVDRGQESIECLRLTKEPWFHMVLGNHEILLLNYLGLRDDGISHGTLNTYVAPWVDQIQDREELAELAYGLLYKPLVMRVDHAEGAFNVVHGELRCKHAGHVLTDLELDNVDPIDASWGERLQDMGRLMHNDEVKRHARRENSRHTLLVTSRAMEPGLSLTYVGHRILNYPMLYRSHLYIDRGAYLAEPGDPDRLWLVEHADLTYRLQHAMEIDTRQLLSKQRPAHVSVIS